MADVAKIAVRRALTVALGVVLLLAVPIRARSPDPPAPASASRSMLAPQSESNYQLRPYEGKLQPDDGQWVRPAKDYTSTRYSTPDLINTQNASNLKLAFTFSTGPVVNRTTYIVTPGPNKLFALDLTRPDAPRKWAQPPASQGVACCATWLSLSTWSSLRTAAPPILIYARWKSG